MKIFINFDIKNEPWGGGNTFLKALRKEFIARDIYEENPLNADVILLNSHQKFDNIWKYQKLNKKAVFPHRLSGPHKWRYDNTDKLANQYANSYADGIIFQSNYSQKAYSKNGFHIYKPTKIILNGVDTTIFSKKIFTKSNEKIKIIITSWSDNFRKGFNDYKFLDENLDFDRYEVVFVGRSPIEFKNIKTYGTLKSEQLAEKLRSCDIYLTASLDDPCSNALLEGIASGLVPLYKLSGGHPDIIKKCGDCGLGFNSPNEMLEVIKNISSNLEFYFDKIKPASIKETTNEYISFFKNLIERKN